MTREQFIELLKEKGVHFSEYCENGLDQIWIYSKKEFELKNKHPRKYKNLYIPYIRVSHFNERENFWYTRENGYVEWKFFRDVINKVLIEYN